MTLGRSPIFRIIVALTILAVPVAAFAKDNVGTAVGGGAAIEWQLKISGHDRVDMVVLGPDGTSWARSFPAGRTPSLRLLDLGSSVEDGQYNYELRVAPNVPSDVKKKLAAARAANDKAAARKIIKEAGISAPVQSGTFTILNGMIVSPNGVEADANDSASATGPRSIGSEATTVKPRLSIAVEDQVIPDDLIVQGSTCTGFDCVDNESFGADTLRLKENNLRINFDDTSSSAGYAANDWRIVANDQASGGANYLAFEDSTAGRNTFIVEAGAPANALYVDSTGNIGISQSTPLLDLHITATDTPAMRYEQTAGAFTAQTWDIGANEANFFVRDLTGGSKLSFRIRPGAPTSSIDIAASGKVGMGTGSPAERLHVFENADVNSIMQIQNENTGSTAAAVVRADADLATVNITAHSTGRGVTRFGQTLNGWNELLAVSGNGLAIGTNSNSPLILGTNNVNRLHITNGGDIGINCNAPTFDLVIASGVGCTGSTSSINAGSAQFTIASSRTFKENIQPVAVPDILEKIDNVGVYNYDYINGPKDRMGLIAEDFHEVFGRGSEKYIDGNDVQMALWLAVKELAAENKQLTERLKEIENKIPQQ